MVVADHLQEPPLKRHAKQASNSPCPEETYAQAQAQSHRQASNDPAPTSVLPSLPSAIPPSNFFGRSHRRFIPPALASGVGREAVRRSRAQDANHSVKLFHTQRDAFEYCDARPGQRLRVWAYEIDTGGRRRFIAASYIAFWRSYSRVLRVPSRQAHFYEVIREAFAAKLYLDLEFLRAYNPDVHCEKMVESLIDACQRMAGARQQAASVVVLDSTTERKFSRHLIFQDIAFCDNVQMGDFMSRVVEDVRQRDESLIMVKSEDGKRVPFVDLGVYTKNRCFRLAGSSKFGKTARLLQLGANQDPSSVSKMEFLRSLVCNVKHGVKLLGETGRRAERVGFKRVRGGDSGHGEDGSTWISSVVTSNERSPFTRLDEYVQSVVSRDGGGIYSVTVLGESETVVYAIKGGYKFCSNIGRHHKSNNVMLIADLSARRMYQKCFDPDCRGFRSAAWVLPSEVFGSVEAGECYNVQDEDLVRMMDELEGEGETEKYNGGISDEVMNEALDVMLNVVDGMQMNARDGS